VIEHAPWKMIRHGVAPIRIIGSGKYGGKKHVIAMLPMDPAVSGFSTAAQIRHAECIVTAVNSHDGLLEALEQAALELEEAANVLSNSLPSLASIFETAAEQKRATIKAARP